MAYTTLDQVCAFFPGFARNGPKGPQDADIQNWINDVTGQIDAVLQRRFQEAYQPLGTTLSTAFAAWVAMFGTDQLSVLEHINHAGACAELANALVTSGIASAQRAADRFGKEYAEEIRKLNARDERGKPMTQGGYYDFLFDPIAKVETPRPQLGGIAGGDQYPSQTRDEGTTATFKKWDRREF
jgi:hypothetical protein